MREKRLVVAQPIDCFFIARFTPRVSRSIPEPGIHIGAVDGRVASGRPTGSHLQQLGVVRIADVNASGGDARTLNLRVTAQTQVGVARDEHFFVDRTVRIMAGGAAFAQRLMPEDERSRLLAMALGAAFILPGHGESARRFEDVAAVRVMALRAAHMSFDDRVMLREVEFGLNVEMALQTGGRVLAGIDDEFCAAAGLEVFAAGAVAGFTAGFTGHGCIFKMDPRVRTHGKFPDDFCVAIRTGLVADEMSAGNFERHDHHGRGGGGRGPGEYGAGHGSGSPDCESDRHPACEWPQLP